jgi:hypothetical protein
MLRYSEASLVGRVRHERFFAPLRMTRLGSLDSHFCQVSVARLREPLRIGDTLDAIVAGDPSRLGTTQSFPNQLAPQAEQSPKAALGGGQRIRQ